MAKAPGIDCREKLSDLTECSICAQIFTNPKILPCVHTFCLHCLDKYGNDKKPGDQMACPTCRNHFFIPDKGMSELPNNFFIGKIVDIGKLTTFIANEAVCELCCEETAVAKKFCIDCEHKLCDRCSSSHRRIKDFQNHQVVELGSQINVQELNFRRTYCEHHPKELIKMYCHEDNVAICLICCVESHQSHRCSNVDKAAEQFTKQLRDDLRKVANRRPDCEETFQKLDNFKEEFTKEVLTTEESIRNSGVKLKELIDQHTEELVQNLREVRDRNLKYFEQTKQDVDRFRVMIDSYQRYCNDLLARGSPVDLCRAANQMRKRANDLEQQPANCSADDFNCDKISFLSANLETVLRQQGTNNFVGELTATKSSDWILHFRTKIWGMDVPANWETMRGDEELKTIQLKASDKEYKDVEKAVLSTSKTCVNEIVKIERIQNKMLYKQYVLRKAAMDTANPGVQNEMTLWFGTSSVTTLEKINRTGFSRSCCGQNGILGTGVYFAKNFSQSAQNKYRSQDRSGLKHVYQCKVLKGASIRGNRFMSAPPSKTGNQNLKYDSIVDNIDNPTVLVIYDDTQAYPEYLICFK